MVKSAGVRNVLFLLSVKWKVPEYEYIMVMANSLLECEQIQRNMCMLWHDNIVGGVCAAGDLDLNSRCYRKFDSQLTWYDASNECLTRGGSLAVFSRIGRPSDNNELTTWLNASGTDKSYWIGLVRSSWKTTDESNFNHFLRILHA